MIVPIKHNFSIETYAEFLRVFGGSEKKPLMIKIEDSIAYVKVTDFIEYWVDFENQDIRVSELPVMLAEPFNSFVANGSYWDAMEYMLKNMVDMHVCWFYKTEMHTGDTTIEVLVLDLGDKNNE